MNHLCVLIQFFIFTYNKRWIRFVILGCGVVKLEGLCVCTCACGCGSVLVIFINLYLLHPYFKDE